MLIHIIDDQGEPSAALQRDAADASQPDLQSVDSAKTASADILNRLASNSTAGAMPLPGKVSDGLDGILGDERGTWRDRSRATAWEEVVNQHAVNAFDRPVEETLWPRKDLFNMLTSLEDVCENQREHAELQFAAAAALHDIISLDATM